MVSLNAIIIFFVSKCDPKIPHGLVRLLLFLADGEVARSYILK